jgi:hypothetical protein
MNLEHDLERALRRESPAPGFANRVLQRIEAEERPSAVEERRSRLSGQTRLSVFHSWRAAAASVTLAVLLGGYATHKVVEHRRGIYARDQVLEAMRIAGEKVRYAQQEVRDIGTHD